jgi:hypothetical protein
MALVRAAYNENIAEVKRLLEEGTDVNQTERRYIGRTALHMAAAKGNYDMVKLLLEHGATVDARDEGNNTPLLVAMLESQAEVAELLIDNGADIKIVQDYKGGSYGNAIKEIVVEGGLFYNPNENQQQNTINTLAMLLRKHGKAANPQMFVPEENEDNDDSDDNGMNEWNVKRELHKLGSKFTKSLKNQAWRRRRHALMAYAGVNGEPAYINWRAFYGLPDEKKPRRRTRRNKSMRR